MRRTVFTLALLFGLGVILAPAVLAQAVHQAELSSSVPELEAFHEVIMPMWHTAYPNKDYATLRTIAKDVQAGSAKIVGVTLPGILHEKETAWSKGIAEFKAASDAYLKAAAGASDAALLTAAENLHTSYEALVRVIRPVVPEMEEFHKILYVANHTYLPEKNWTGIKSVSADLITKAEALSKATLPKRVEAKSDAFKKATASLVADARALDAACKAGKPEGVEKAFEALHMRYQGIEKIFE